MKRLTNWLSEKYLTLKIGTPVHIANDGKPIDQVTIRYKDFYFFVDIDIESGEPTGDFGWSTDPTMNPTVPVRGILIATPAKQLNSKDSKD